MSGSFGKVVLQSKIKRTLQIMQRKHLQLSFISDLLNDALFAAKVMWSQVI
jgi:hypothetical protein